MKALVSLLFCLFAVIYSSTVFAHEKVVVLPMLSKAEAMDGKMANVVTVAKSGGDFTNPVTAAQSITDASETNPYLIFIGPGTYPISNPIILKDFVSLAGSGQKVTVIKNAFPLNGGNVQMVQAKRGSQVSDLTLFSDVEDTYDLLEVISMNQVRHAEDLYPSIQNVTILLTGGAGTIFGINSFADDAIFNNIVVKMTTPNATYVKGVSIAGSAVRVNDVRVLLGGGQAVDGINILGSNSGLHPVTSNVFSIVNGNGDCHAFINKASLNQINGLTAKAFCHGNNHGIYNFRSSASYSNAVVRAEGNGTNIGIYNDGNVVSYSNVDVKTEGGDTSKDYPMFCTSNNLIEIRNSRFEGEQYSHFSESNYAVKIFNSSLIGLVSGTGTYNCVNSNNGIDKELNSSCAEVTP